MGRILNTILLVLASAGATAAEQNLLFILDASGSMWGRVDDTPKISVARDVMSDLVGRLPEASHAGLLAYGHRRKGDCSDIESLVALGPLDRKALTSRIQALNPKGKTPITEAVKQAVAELRAIEEPASIVLVSDGLESCGGDPCEAVRAARQSGVDFRLHVVGFDLGDADPAQLQCMADAGGGEFYTAANADELTGALERAVAVKPGLLLEVVSNGEPTKAAVVPTRLAGPDSSDRQLDEAYVGDSPDNNPQHIALDPGTYDLRVTATELDGDRSKTLSEVTIPDGGEIERTVDFSDGNLSVGITANGELQKGWVGVFAADDEDKRIAQRYPKANAEDNPRTFRLPPGEYAIKVSAEGIAAPLQWVRGIQVAAGETVSRSVDFSSGTLSVRLTANGELQKGWVGVFAADDDDNRVAQRYPKANAENNPRFFRLPPGDYAIKTSAEGIAAPVQWIRGITVTAGETTERSVDFAAGTLSVGVTVDGQLAKGWVGVYPAGDEDNRLAQRYPKASAENNPRFFRLPPGEYDVYASAENVSAEGRWLRGIEIEAGTVVDRAVDFPGD